MADQFRIFWPFAKPFRLRLAVVILLSGVSPVAAAGGVWVFHLIIDRVLVPGRPDRLVPLLALLGVFTLMESLADYIEAIVSAWVSSRFIQSIRRSLLGHLLKLSPEFFDKHPLGDLLARLSGDVSAIEGFVLSGLQEGLSNTLRITVLGTALFLLEWKMALSALLIVPFFVLLARRFAGRTRALARARRQLTGALSTSAEEILGSITAVQANNGETAELGRFTQDMHRLFEADMKSAQLRALYRPFVDVLELIGGGSAVAFGAFQIRNGTLTFGELTAFLAYLTQLFGPIRGLSRLSQSMQSAAASGERVVELFAATPSVTERRAVCEVPFVDGTIHFRNVSFRYPHAETDALQDVSFSISPGRTMAIVGPSGAGKTTVARLLQRWYSPTSGDLRIDGVNVNVISIDSLRRHMTYVPQDPAIFDTTLSGNIRYGRPDATEEQVARALETADLFDDIAKMPEGLDTRAGQRGRRLSGGQRQKVAIARGLLRNTPIVILDEPTTGLDAASTSRIMAPLRRLIHGRTTVIITHNLMLARDADLIVVLSHGRVVDQGNHAALYQRCDLYRTLCRESGTSDV